MKFIILLALLCCCYAAEQTPSLFVKQEEGRYHLPQHIKDSVKQQIPIVQTEIQEIKVKFEIVKPTKINQQVPENIKKFIKSHISKILQHVAQQKGNKKLDSTRTLEAATFVVDKTQKLKQHVKNRMQQAESHIPQVLNKQIAYKNELKDKQQSISIGSGKKSTFKDTKVAQHEQHHVPKHTKTIDNIQKVSSNNNDASDQKQQQHINTKLVQPPIAENCKDCHANILPAASQHVPQIQHKEKLDKTIVPQHSQPISQEIHVNITHFYNDTKSNEKKPIVPGHIQNLVEQIHHHVPQVINKNIEQVQKKVIKIPANVLRLVEHIHHHVPQIINQHIALAQKKDHKETSIVTERIQGIVQQFHQHVPQVLKQHVAEVKTESHHDAKQQKTNVVLNVNQSNVNNKHNGQKEPEVSGHEQDIADKADKENTQGISGQIPAVDIKQHIAQVKHKNNQNSPIVPDQVQSIVQKVHQHVPQIVKQHVAEGQNVVDKAHVDDAQTPKRQAEGEQIALDGAQSQVSNEYVAQGNNKIEQRKSIVPISGQDQNQQLKKAVKETSVLNGHIPATLEHNHQIIKQNVALTDKKNNSDEPAVPAHIQSIVEQIHNHVPQIIKHIKRVQRKDDEANSIAAEHNVEETFVIPADVKNIFQKIHQHVPQVVNHHVAQVEKKDVHGKPIVPSNIQGVVQQIHQELPQVINHNEDHVAEEQISIAIPNQHIIRNLNTHIVTPDINSFNSYVHLNVHPIVQEIERLTQHKDIANANIAPSRVQQVQKEYHISPVRTT